MRRSGPQEPLHLYIRCKRESLQRSQDGGAPDDPMTQAFLRSFEEIIYPAWRFFARHWHDEKLDQPLIKTQGPSHKSQTKSQVLL